MHTSTPLYAIVVLALIGAFLYFCNDRWCMFFVWQETRSIHSFEECEAAGFPVMESYPRQCNAGGNNFVEEIQLPFENDKVRVFEPAAEATVTSPLTVRGEARGNWYFEASFPVELLDGNGQRLVIVPAQAQGEWMTTEFVPFEVALTFEAPLTPTGTLRLIKDNPSGLPEHDDVVEIPVRFNTALSTGAGILQGTLTLGPVCPVEREGEPCEPTAEMYAARRTYCKAAGRVGADGRFALQLPAGTYYINMKVGGPESVTGLPQTVEIEAGSASILRIAVDTGIR